MKDKADGITLMESSPVAVSILRLSIPMMLGSIAQMVYNMTDTFFYSRWGLLPKNPLRTRWSEGGLAGELQGKEVHLSLNIASISSIAKFGCWYFSFV